VERRLATPPPGRGDEVDLVVYRVAQEALTNVMRHSGADRALVSLDTVGRRLLLVVRDNGRGIDDPLPPDTNGVAGMRERALLVGGRVSLTQAEGGGTEVVLEVPLGDRL
jgi:two-component system sensor histidine kinase UhpB